MHDFQLILQDNIMMLLMVLQYGLYNAFAGPLAYALFGSVKEITEAPTAVIAIMVQSYAVNYGPEYVIVLSFLSGCFELIAGLLNLGLFLKPNLI